MAESGSPEFLAENKGPHLKAGILAPTLVSAFVVLARLSARYLQVNNFSLGLDDALISAAQIFSILNCAFNFIVVDNGIGRHMAAIQPAGLMIMGHWLVATQFMYFLTLGLARWSGLWFYYRLSPFNPFLLWLKMACGLVTAILFIQALIIGFQCVPLSAAWDGSEGTCLGSRVIFLTTGLLTIFCDCVILILPIYIVRQLKAQTWKRKAALALVMCCGFLASVIRLLHYPAFAISDSTWYLAEVLVISNVEVACAIIALSLPCLQFIIPKKFITRVGSRFDAIKSKITDFFGRGNEKLRPGQVQKATPPQAESKQDEVPAGLGGWNEPGANRDSQTDTVYGSRAPRSIIIKRSFENWNEVSSNDKE